MLIRLVLVPPLSVPVHPEVIIRIVPLSAHCVQGLCVGFAEDGSTINGANTAARGEDVREDIGSIWWRSVGIMVGGGRHGCFV